MLNEFVFYTYENARVIMEVSLTNRNCSYSPDKDIQKENFDTIRTNWSLNDGLYIIIIAAEVTCSLSSNPFAVLDLFMPTSGQYKAIQWQFEDVLSRWPLGGLKGKFANRKYKDYVYRKMLVQEYLKKMNNI